MVGRLDEFVGSLAVGELHFLGVLQELVLSDLHGYGAYKGGS